MSVFTDTAKLVSRYAEQHESVLVAFSGGKDSVHEDSEIWVQLNGKHLRTTPKALLPLLDGSPSFLKNGQTFVRPQADLRILTASTRVQKTATPVYMPVSFVMHHDLGSGHDLYEISLSGGRQLRVTGDHSIMVASSTSLDGVYGMVAEPKEARLLNVGDTLFRVTDYGFDGDEVDVPDWLLRLCGLWVADGCFVFNRGKPLGKMIISTGGNEALIDFLRNIPRPKTRSEIAAERFSEVKNEHASQAAAVSAVAAELGVSKSCVINPIYRPLRCRASELFCRVKPNGDAWICCRSLVDRMKSLGFFGKCKEKRVPAWLFTASRRQVAVFLAGYFDGDGCLSDKAISCATVNRELADDIRRLLWRLGIDSGLGTSSSVGGFSTSTKLLYSVNIGSVSSIRKFIETVPCFKSNENLAAMELRRTGYAFKSNQIVGIKTIPAAGVRVFDFEVEDNHMFVADDMLVHNSLVCLDMCSRAFKRVICYFMYFVPGLKVVEDELQKARDRWGVDILYYPHWITIRCIKDGVFCPDYYKNDRIPDISVMDINKLAMEETGIDLIAHGAKKADSLWRRRNLATTKDKNPYLFYPVLEWTKWDVIAYLKANKIPIPDSDGGNATGVDLSTPSLLWLHDKYPDDFDQLCKTFPFARAVVHRRDWYGVQ